MTWRIGVDIGGTFTDVALVEEEGGRIGIAKVPTTPRDFSQGVLAGLKAALSEHAIAAKDVTLLAHATTVVTNALLENKGARIALVTTRGFRDVLELRRSSRIDLYDLFQDAPAVLVPRRRRFEITERIDAQGAVVTPFADAEVPELVRALQAARVEAIAICLMFSFLNDAHEKRLAAALRSALPGLPIFVSSEVLPEIREFERTSTTAVCAYVGPILEGYLRRLEAATGSLGLPKLHVMGSSGGVFDVAEGLKMPVMAVESGPAAGVIAAALIGKQLGRANLLSFDMGGTTAKASLIENGRVETTSDYEVGGGGNVSRWMHGTGHPIRVPVIDLAEVSAGGGSIAWIDPAGALRVGPKSAGAEPGPVCYGQGGTEPTVTDANLLLGYLDARSLLGGKLPIDFARAEAAVMAHIAGPLGQTALDAAAGVVAVVDNAMAEALRIVSLQRGRDPREFSLVAFGGAGPLHACRLADELQIPEVIVPPIPGGFSALGLVGSDLKREYVRTFFARLDRIDTASLDAAFAELEGTGRGMLDSTGVAAADRAIERAADVRYVRQAYELTVPFPDGAVTRAGLDRLATTFHERHRQTYGHDNPAEPVQLVNIRVTALGRRPGLTIRQPASAGPARKGRRQAWFRETGRVEVEVLARERLAAGSKIDGPAIVESLDSTLVVPPGWRGTVDGDGFLLLARRAHA
jgi:N-methylhydantoinase A